MNAQDAQFRPVAYVKEGCPYSKKLLDFLTEAGLTDRVDIVRCAPGTPTMEAVKEKLSSATGSAPTFPTVEVEPGKFRTESDQLIRYFSQKYAKQRDAE
jgi:glutaredoxin